MNWLSKWFFFIFLVFGKGLLSHIKTIQLPLPTTMQRTNHSSLFRSIPTIQKQFLPWTGQRTRVKKTQKPIKEKNEVFLYDSVWVSPLRRSKLLRREGVVKTYGFFNDSSHATHYLKFSVKITTNQLHYYFRNKVPLLEKEVSEMILEMNEEWVYCLY